MNQELIRRLSKIKMLVTDVDGVMTDGKIFLGAGGEWVRSYSVRDGEGIVFLRQAGYQTAIITGAIQSDVQKRADHLKFDYVYKGQVDKGPAFDEIKKLTGYTNEELAYVGDDVFDIPLLRQAGFAASVPGGMDPVKEVCHYITTRIEGDGALREVCDLILKYGFHSQKGV